MTEQVLTNILLLLTSSSREVSAAGLSFIKVESLLGLSFFKVSSLLGLSFSKLCRFYRRTCFFKVGSVLGVRTSSFIKVGSTVRFIKVLFKGVV